MSTQKSLDDLVETLNLERLEENLYRGECEKTAWGRVFGGQVLGQSLSAAYNTIEENRYAHSFHAYFLRPGRIDMPIVYNVVRIRDGGSFTTNAGANFRVVGLSTDVDNSDYSAANAAIQVKINLHSLRDTTGI